MPKVSNSPKLNPLHSTIMNNRWISIRRQARDLLRKYEEVARAEGLPSAFTSEEGSYAVLKHILERCFPRPYSVKFSRNLPTNVRGEINDTIGTISIDRSLPQTLRAFIIAHEIAHIWLKHSPRLCSGDAASVSLSGPSLGVPPETDLTINQEPHAGNLECRDGIAPSYRENDRIELEANIFAAELLAPLTLVRQKIESSKDWKVEDLAVYFGISEDAMRNQLIAALIACPQPDVIENDIVPAQLPKPDKKQEAAVICDTPALIVAGPGAGKTGVLTERYVYLVKEKKIAPGRILALTFSNKAAAEMHERITARLPDQAHEIVVHTYHSYGRFLLQGYGDRIGFDEETSILSDTDSFVLARDHIDKLPMGDLTNLNDPTRSLGALIIEVQNLKEAQISPAEFERRVKEWGRELKQARENYQDTVEWKTALQCRDVARFYEAYEALRREENCVDYADLINLTISLFAEDKMAATLCSLYDEILVDEFQDVNQSCGQLVQLTGGGRGIVWAVADPRQTIYSFRGASVSHLAHFERDYPGAKTTFLDVNYRSVEQIVRVADAIQLPVIANGQAFSPPQMRADKGSKTSKTPVVTVSECPTRGHEIAHLVRNVGRVIQTVAPDQVAILCRDKWWARDICQALEAQNIATNWSGQLEEQEAFKDMMAVLQLATSQPQSLLRLNHIKEHFLCEADTRIILRAAGNMSGRLRQALRAASDGTLPDISDEGRVQARQLGRLSYDLAAPHKARKRTAWQVLSVYLLEKSRWLREKLANPTPENRRYLAAMCQVIDLAREFGHKSSFANASDARAFLDYIASARESKKLPCVDSTQVIADAVNVLTTHKSKGLQWHTVFVPHWREKTGFARPKEITIPAHLRGIDENQRTTDEKYSEACLYYVASTRAEEQLFLSTSTQSHEYSERLPFLRQIVEALEDTKDVTFLQPNEMPWKRPKLTYALTPFEEQEIPYSMIRQYEYCPRRAKYDYLYNLRTESSGFRFFRSRLHQALSWIAEEIGRGEKPTPEAIKEKIDVLWTENSRSKQKMSRLYYDQALRCARTFVQHLTPGVKIILNEKWEVDVPNTNPPVKLTFKINQRQETPPIVSLHKLAGKHEKHRSDAEWSLYAQLLSNETETTFELSYLALDEQIQMEVAPQASWNESKFRAICRRVESIQRGEFPPKPKDDEMCHRCPYNLTCPA